MIVAMGNTIRAISANIVISENGTAVPLFLPLSLSSIA